MPRCKLPSCRILFKRIKQKRGRPPDYCCPQHGAKHRHDRYRKRTRKALKAMYAQERWDRRAVKA